MSGENDLAKVLASLQVTCDEKEYGFGFIANNIVTNHESILAWIKEEEGLTIIATREYLDINNIQFDGIYARLTIEVRTSLALIGLTAILTKKLAECSISANVVAAFYHDHIFVPYEQRHGAITAMMSLKNTTKA